MIVDINDPSKPREVSRWWYPGTWTAGGEKAGKGWFAGGGARCPLPDIWLDVHDMTVYKDRAYVAYRDQGVVILDVSDMRKPTMRPHLRVFERAWRRIMDSQVYAGS